MQGPQSSITNITERTQTKQLIKPVHVVWWDTRSRQAVHRENLEIVFCNMCHLAGLQYRQAVFGKF